MSYNYSNYAHYPENSNRANEEHSLTLLVRAERAMLKDQPTGRLRRDTMTEVEEIISRHSPPHPPIAGTVNNYPPPRPPAPATTNLGPSTRLHPTAQSAELNSQLHHRKAMDALQLQSTEIVESLKLQHAEIADGLQFHGTQIVDALQRLHTEVVDALQFQSNEIVDALQYQRTEIVAALNDIGATLQSKLTTQGSAINSDIELRQHKELVDALFNVNATLESIRREIREGKRGVGAKLDNIVKKPGEDGDDWWSSGCCVVS